MLDVPGASPLLPKPLLPRAKTWGSVISWLFSPKCLFPSEYIHYYNEITNDDENALLLCVYFTEG